MPDAPEPSTAAIGAGEPGTRSGLDPRPPADGHDPFEPEPRLVDAPDGVRIAVFRLGSGPPILLVHGVAADHTTWRRIAGPLARTRTVLALDRRGRGQSTDGPAHRFGLEVDDLLAAIADARTLADGPLDIVAHSLGGRIALAAARRSTHIRRLVLIEGVPVQPDDPDEQARIERRLTLAAALRRLVATGDPEAALVRFLRDSVGLRDADVAAYQAHPVWPRRVAAANTLAREIEAIGDAEAAFEALVQVGQPSLLVVGGDSPPRYPRAAAAFAADAGDARIVVIPGARHAPHHTHPDALLEAIGPFLA